MAVGVSVGVIVGVLVEVPVSVGVKVTNGWARVISYRVAERKGRLSVKPVAVKDGAATLVGAVRMVSKRKEWMEEISCPPERLVMEIEASLLLE